MTQTINIETIRRLVSLIAAQPNISNRKLAQSLGIGRTSATKYRALLDQANISLESIGALSDEVLSRICGFTTNQASFVEPDWEEIRVYLNTKRVWGKMLPTERSAWVNLYLKHYFPNFSGEGCLPDGCMSERTFNRRYSKYLHDKGLDILRHQPYSNNNFGPASMVEIDTIGDRFEYINAKGEHQKAVIFTAVLKYSGYIYAEAMSSGSGICWAVAIINALYFFGGVPEVLRCDNDKALCQYGSPTRLRATIEMVVREFKLGTDLCPVRSPKWKGTNERANLTLQKHLFESQLKSSIPHVDDLTHLNRVLLQEVMKINSASRSHGQLSRLEIFKRYEESFLKPLPLVRPTVKYMSYAFVRKNGYVTYQNNYYYAGIEQIGKTIIIENNMGKNINLRKDGNLKVIVSYELDKNAISPRHYHKADCFKTETERVTSRTKEWFISAFENLTEPHEAIVKVIQWLFEVFKSSSPVATRLCNQIYNLYSKNPQDIDCLNATCEEIVKKACTTELRTQISRTFNLFSRIKEMGADAFSKFVTPPLNSTYEQKEDDSSNTTNNQPKDSDSVRGEEYYHELFK